jgi:transcriptional regulator with GAF, ATPase, and Fis domain
VHPRDQTTASVPVEAGPGPLGAWIRVVEGRGFPNRFRLTEGVCRVGAGTDTDIVIQDDAVSRRHLEFELVPEGVQVRDLGSRNGTFYRGQRIDRATLCLGTSVVVGKTTIRIEADLNSLETAAAGESKAYGELLGVSPEIRGLFAKLSRLEGCLVNVLVEGESGTGKELVARAIHEHSRVRSGPFVAINCGALDRQLAKSELFGHKRGAFTGAVDHRVGAFEAADGGTLFLDELGELALDVQPILLRTLETGAVTRLGENDPRPAKVRVIAATNRDLREEVALGRFREDLYYRITVVRLLVPPLRDRLDDIEVLARHFAEQEAVGPLSTDVIVELRRREWPGNVRELRNAVLAYAALGTLAADHPVDHISPLEGIRQFVDTNAPYARQKEVVAQTFTRIYLEELMIRTAGNQSEAARISGLDRTYLGKLVTKFGIGKK